MIRATIAQAQGARAYQEDRAVIGAFDGVTVAVLADGMGGQRYGAEAAAAAVDAVIGVYRGCPLSTGVGPTSHDVLRAACGAVISAAPGGGCTLEVVVVYPDRVDVLHVGDSRVWRDGELVTEPHAYGHYLTSCIPLVEDVGVYTIPRRGRIVIASDGVERPASGDAQAVVDAQLALGREHQDNATAIVLDLDGAA